MDEIRAMLMEEDLVFPWEPRVARIEYLTLHYNGVEYTLRDSFVGDEYTYRPEEFEQAIVRLIRILTGKEE